MRNAVAWGELQPALGVFGRVNDLWLPWKSGDDRDFGFVRFNDEKAAAAAAAASPLKVAELVEIVCSPKLVWDDEPDIDEAAGFLRKLSLQHHQKLQWSDYLASADLEAELKAIAFSFDNEHAQELQKIELQEQTMP